MLAELAGQARAPPGRRPRRSSRRARPNLRLAAIGLTALLDGLWLEWCLEPGTFRPAEAVALCEAWVQSLCRRSGRS
jgi:hypothetical protein